MSSYEEKATWQPQVGEIVCDCRYKHVAVESIDPADGTAILTDGQICNITACLAPADHDAAGHEECLRQFRADNPGWQA
jgi:hypothetical protein